MNSSTYDAVMEKHGSREELTDHLDEMAVGWHHLAKDEMRDGALDAAEQLRGGADEVKAGHTVYRVVT